MPSAWCQPSGIYLLPGIEPLKMVAREGNNFTFEARLAPKQAGEYRSAVRLYPKKKELPHRQDFCYLKWLELPQTI